MAHRLIRKSEFKHKLGDCSDSTFDRLRDIGVVPPPVYLGPRTPLWPEEDADQAIAKIARDGLVTFEEVRALNRDIPRPGRPKKNRDVEAALA